MEGTDEVISMRGKIIVIIREDSVDWDAFIWSNPNRVVYGPVSSRRLGASLGINLFPGKKICSFGCIYCDCGPTVSGWKLGSSWNWVKKEQIIGEINRGLHEVRAKGIRPDYITFSGNGEPTLHPEFLEIVEEVARMRDELFAGVPLAIFTNGVHLNDEKVQKALYHFDVRIVKLDAADDDKIRFIDRPSPPFSIGNLVKSLHELPPVCLSTAVIPGPQGNVEAILTDKYVEIIKDVKPTEVHLYSFDYPVAKEGLFRAPLSLMVKIAEFISKNIPVTVKVLARRNPHHDAPPPWQGNEL